MKYRRLRIGEIVQKDDELLNEDATTWRKVTDIGGYIYRFGYPPMRRPIEGEPAPPGLPVRIAVAVDPETKSWHACGWNLITDPGDDTRVMNHARKFFKDTTQCSWVEAVIPITYPPVIVGRVEKEGE